MASIRQVRGVRVHRLALWFCRLFLSASFESDAEAAARVAVFYRIERAIVGVRAPAGRDVTAQATPISAMASSSATDGNR
jgi:hypothetical protein